MVTIELVVKGLSELALAFRITDIVVGRHVTIIGPHPANDDAWWLTEHWTLKRLTGVISSDGEHYLLRGSPSGSVNNVDTFPAALAAVIKGLIPGVIHATGREWE